MATFVWYILGYYLVYVRLLFSKITIIDVTIFLTYAFAKKSVNYD